jgi:phenylalanyl-tRNA synthetase alpha chain
LDRKGTIVIDEVAAALDAALAQVASATTLDDWRAVRSSLTGKQSALGLLNRRLGALPAEDRAVAGKAVVDARATLDAELEERRRQLAEEERQVQLAAERLDLTEAVAAHRPSRGHLHLVTQTHERLEDVFVGMGFTVAEGPEVETDWYNFTALNMPPHHPARSEWDTMFVDLGEPGSVVLRTHTSPVQIRTLESQAPPLYIVSMGTCFRRDTPDATHMPVFHQIEGLVVDRGITFTDLAGTIEAFTQAYFGKGYTSRLRPSYFPFTEPSAEFDVQRPDGSWLELGGCGMVHPNVLRNCGVDPEQWSGFAFGFGTDRMPLMRHGIDDLREMFTNDVRFLEQF